MAGKKHHAQPLDPNMLEERQRRVGILESLVTQYENDGQTRKALAFDWARKSLLKNDVRPMKALRWLDPNKPFPCTIEEFLHSTEFLGHMDEFSIWESHRERVLKMNPDVFCGAEPVTEVALGGASGTGKTTLGWVNMAYQFFLLSCLRKPQVALGLAPITPIVFTMQSLSQTVTKLVIYQPFKTMLTNMPYVKRWLNWDRQREGQIDFDNNIHIIPALARGTSLQGQAVVGGILDELAFMSVIEASKQVPGPRGQGGKFDQAEEVYSATINRRNRSFDAEGVSIGCVVCLSNTYFKDDFMDRHLNRLEQHNPPFTMFARLKRHQVAPLDVAQVRRGETMRVQVGNDYVQTRILGAKEQEDEGATVEVIPERYRGQFLNDPDGALREVVGIASAAISPFIRNRNKIVDAFNAGEVHNLVPYVDIQDADLFIHGLPNWQADLMPTDLDKPRFIHIDLSKSKDRCGIAIIKPFGLVNVTDPDNPNAILTVPQFAVECAISLKPSGNFHVEPTDIRTWLMQLATVHGMNIGGVSYDGYQSQESLTAWRRAGVTAKELSVDRNMEPYEYFRHALYQDRVAMCHNDILLEELVMLEHNKEANKDRGGKVDHPPKGSKDIADAVAGAIYNCSQQRAYWSKTGYHDAEGERVRVRKTDTAPGVRPKGGSRRTTGRRKARNDKRQKDHDVRPPRDEMEIDDQMIRAMPKANPPTWWKETHGKQG